MALLGVWTIPSHVSPAAAFQEVNCVLQFLSLDSHAKQIYLQQRGSSLPLVWSLTITENALLYFGDQALPSSIDFLSRA
jgi:hypothetical protein